MVPVRPPTQTNSLNSTTTGGSSHARSARPPAPSALHGSKRRRAVFGKTTRTPMAEATLLARTGFIDHIGIGVPDLVAAKKYYDDLMSVLGLREIFETGSGGQLNYGPDGARGSQCLLPSRGTRYLLTPGDRPSSPRILGREQSHRSRSHEWARTHEAVILDEPGEFPHTGHTFRDLLAGSPRIQAGGGLPQSRGEPGGLSLVASLSRQPGCVSQLPLPGRVGWSVG